MNTAALELAHRLSGPDEVLLLWHPENDQVELSIHNAATGATYHLEVARGSAIDAFHHPYAYMAWRGDSTSVVVSAGR